MTRATGAQVAYLRRLLNEAFAAHVGSAFDVNHLERVTQSEASNEIVRLKVLKALGWQSDPSVSKLRVYDAKTGNALVGAPSYELIAASLDEEVSEVLVAMETDDGGWHYTDAMSTWDGATRVRVY